MHVFIAGLYGFTIWLSCLAAAVMLRADWALVLWLGPVIVCAAMVFPLAGRLGYLALLVRCPPPLEHCPSPGRIARLRCPSLRV